MDAPAWVGDDTRDLSAYTVDPPDACPHCEARDGEPHGEACPLYLPTKEQQQRTKADTAAFRRMQAAHASRTQVVAWLRKHAKGMKPDSHNALYLERAAQLIEREAAATADTEAA